MRGESQRSGAGIGWAGGERGAYGCGPRKREREVAALGGEGAEESGRPYGAGQRWGRRAARKADSLSGGPRERERRPGTEQGRPPVPLSCRGYRAGRRGGVAGREGAGVARES